MTKSDLAVRVAARLNLPAARAEDVVDTIFGGMTRALARGERIELRGLGTFEVRSYKGYEGRNPKTGETMPVGPKKLPFFRVGKELNDRLNRKPGAAPSTPAVAPSVTTMKRLFVTNDLGNLLLGGLLAVARADGIVKPEEMQSLRSTAANLGLAMPAMEEDLLLADEVTAGTLAAAITDGAGAYRASGSAPDEISQAFLEAAVRLALADHELVLEEVVALREFAAVLGVPTERVAGWQAVRSFEV